MTGRYATERLDSRHYRVVHQLPGRRCHVGNIERHGAGWQAYSLDPETPFITRGRWRDEVFAQLRDRLQRAEVHQ